MSFDWSGYLGLARELAGVSTNSSSEEAKLRSAISRAYYAAFVLSRNHLVDKEGIDVPMVDAHTYVVNEYRSNHKRWYQTIGIHLKNMRDYRNKVDYEDLLLDDKGRPISLAKTTKDIIKWAEQVQSILATL